MNNAGAKVYRHRKSFGLGLLLSGTLLLLWLWGILTFYLSQPTIAYEFYSLRFVFWTTCMSAIGLQLSLTGLWHLQVPYAITGKSCLVLFLAPLRSPRIIPLQNASLLSLAKNRILVSYVDDSGRSRRAKLSVRWWQIHLTVKGQEALLADIRTRFEGAKKGQLPSSAESFSL